MVQVKIYEIVSAFVSYASRQVSICPFRHFCCSLYRLATKRTEKNEPKKTRT